MLCIQKINAQQMFKVKADKLQVYNSADENSLSIGYLPIDENVRLLDSINPEWSKIKVQNGEGYVKTFYLEKITKGNEYADVTTHNIKVLIIAGLGIAIIICLYYLFTGSNSHTTLINDGIQAQQIIIKRKSVGVSIILIMFFGPLGMFYSTVKGGITMLLLPLIGILIFLTNFNSNSELANFLSITSLLIFLCLYYPICMIWGAISASKANKIIINSYSKSSIGILVIMLLFSCNFVGQEDKAIELVQNSKYEITNPMDALMFMTTGAKFTNLEAANMLTQNNKDTHYSWKAVDKGNSIYTVTFTDSTKIGPHWEVDLKNKIVKLIKQK